jgi:hypothetical protein
MQDSLSKDSGPYADELAALHALYFKILGDNILLASGRKFLFNNYQLLKGEYSNLSTKDLKRFNNFENYWIFINEHFGASEFSKFIGKILYIKKIVMEIILKFFPKSCF